MSIHSFFVLKMTKVEAIKIVEQYLDNYRKINYSELVKKVGNQETFEGKTTNGDNYQIEVDFIFDDEKEENLRVWGMISYSLWTDFSPVLSDFLISPNGDFIGE